MSLLIWLLGAATVGLAAGMLTAAALHSQTAFLVLCLAMWVPAAGLVVMAELERRR